MFRNGNYVYYREKVIEDWRRGRILWPKLSPRCQKESAGVVTVPCPTRLETGTAGHLKPTLLPVPFRGSERVGCDAKNVTRSLPSPQQREPLVLSDTPVADGTDVHDDLTTNKEAMKNHSDHLETVTL